MAEYSPALDEDDEETPYENPNTVFFPCKLLRKFIHLYRDNPCLWDRKCPAYKQKQKRHEAITRLTKLVQEHNPTATRVHVLRKIESLRACVRRENKRVRDSRRKARSPADVYKPHLWYYNLFSFVFNEENSSKTNEQFAVKEEDKSDHNAESDDDDEPRFEVEAPHEFEQALDPADYNMAPSMAEEAEKPYQFDDDKAKRQCTEVVDEYDAIGVNVAAKLRNLPSNMRILAEKLINDVLFQAQLNGLNASTIIATVDPFKQED